MVQNEITPDEILNFWFPDGTNPDAEKHIELWVWRMRGGANDEIIAKYSSVTQRAADGEFDHWAQTSKGRLALIIMLDQFPRTVWAGTSKAFSQDPETLKLCLEGFDNGHFDALENVWFKTAYRIPLEHCECPEHLENMDRAIAIGQKLFEEAPEHLRPFYQIGVQQPMKHRAVIAMFGRHSHRNEILGRQSTPEELEYIAKGNFPHNTEISELSPDTQ